MGQTPVRWFRKKKSSQKGQESAVNVLPKGKEVTKLMGEWTGSRYKFLKDPGFKLSFIEGGFKGLYVDEEKISALIPSSYTFDFKDFKEFPLDSLNFGFDEGGVAVVGSLHTIVRKKFVDGFINTVKEAYDLSWKDIRVYIHKRTAFPLVMVTKHLTCSIAPIIRPGVDLLEVSWSKGKYDPESMRLKEPRRFKEVVKEKEVIVKIRCPYCSHLYDETLDRCPHCGGKR